MGRKIDVDELIDANRVADLLGLSHRNSVTTYQHRYPSMPRPVVNISKSRIRLWLEPEITEWAVEHERGKDRRKRGSTLGVVDR